MSKDLPVLPVQQVNNLVLLIGIIQKIIHALVESFRVSRSVCQKTEEDDKVKRSWAK